MYKDCNMKIKKFEEHKDELFTDYVLQIFNAHCADDNAEILKILISSFDEQASDNMAFMPGLIFGSMVHMLMMMQIISLEKGISLHEAVQEYIAMYQESRTKLAKMLGNRPEYAKDMINNLPKDFFN